MAQRFSDTCDVNDILTKVNKLKISVYISLEG